MNMWDNLFETDEMAGMYMETYGEGPGSATRDIIGAFINDGESVLDVGCGPGWNYDHFITYGPEVTYRGLDYSEKFIRVAKQRKPEADFRMGDARKLEEDDDSFDVVILQDVLDHTPGYKGPVSEALRVARKRVIITFWRGQMKDENPDNGEDLIRDDGDDGWTGEYSRTLWYQYLESLPYMWMETQDSHNRWHRFFIIDKEEPL